MSKTGTYKIINGKLVKISDRIPNLKHTFFPEVEGHYNYALGKVITSKREMIAEMERTGSIPFEPGMGQTNRPNPQRRLEQIKSEVNEYISGRGVEGIKLRDLDRTMAKERERGPYDVTEPIRTAAGIGE